MVSVVIPALNEEATIAAVLDTVVGHPAVTEIIVVDDGSTDRTAELAERAGVRVIRHAENGGKAAAMDAGVKAAREDVLLFLDADVVGLDYAKISHIIDPVRSGQYDMYVGLRARSTVLLNRMLHVFPIIGGERAVSRRLWEAVPPERKRGFQIEIALNYTAKQSGRGMGFGLIDGLVHHPKERKYGLVKGLIGRARMVADVVAISFRLYVVAFFLRRP